MQKKKELPQESSSNWQESLKKDERKQMMKKIGIWAGILVITLVFLGGLVMLAQKTVPSTTPVENANIPAVRETDIILGNKEAKVTIIEYSDFQCPSCAAANPMVNQLLAEYDGKIRFAYRHFPLSQHKNAKISAQAGEAAWKLGKFKEYKDILFEKQTEWENVSDPSGLFESYAVSINLNGEEFRAIMNSEETKNRVNEAEKEALSLGINSTPSFFIGNKYVGNISLEEFKRLIDEELKAN